MCLYACHVVKYTVDWRGVLSGLEAFFDEFAAMAEIKPGQTVRRIIQCASGIYHGD